LKRRVVTAPAERVEKLSSPFLAELDGLKRSLIRKGRDVIDLSRFNMSIDPSQSGAEPVSLSTSDVKRTISGYLESAYGAKIDPEYEMLLLPGGRATLLLLGAYLVESDRTCYVPDPGFTAYRHMSVLFKGEIDKYKLHERNDYLPNLKQFEEKKPRSLRLLMINSPHNPTGAVWDKPLYAKLEEMAAKENILVIADSSYCLNSIGNFRAPLFCEQHRRLKVGMEMLSLSTNLCAPGLKLTALIGRRQLLTPLGRLVNSFGLIPCEAVLKASSRYFSSVQTLTDHIAKCRSEIRARTSQVAAILGDAGIEYYPLITMPYLWVKLRRNRVSLYFARSLLRRRAVAVSPGSAFGEEGEGWIRIAVNESGERLTQAVNEIVKQYQPIKSRLRERRKE
jgi:LL-diaminopimelate aminotransferase